MERISKVQRLSLREASGIWLVRSSSQTRYILDLRDPEPFLLRLPGPLSPSGPFDGCWVRLTRLRSVDSDAQVAEGVVVVGRRHLYDLDPDPGGVGDNLWWLQRIATSIEEVPEGRVPGGRWPAQDEYAVPFLHRHHLGDAPPG